MKHNLLQKILNKKHRKTIIKLEKDEIEIIQILRNLSNNELRQNVIKFIKSLENQY